MIGTTHHAHTQKRPSPVNLTKDLQKGFNIHPKKMRIIKANDRTSEKQSRDGSRNTEDKFSCEGPRGSQSTHQPVQNSQGNFVYNYLMKSSNCK